MKMRIRSVKPDFFQHRKLATAEFETKLPLRVVYQGLWLAADRKGVFEWKPDQLKLNIIPYDEVDMADCLAALLDRGFIATFWHRKTQWGHVPTLADHQYFNPQEKADRLYPDPELADSVGDPRNRAGRPATAPVNVAELSALVGPPPARDRRTQRKPAPLPAVSEEPAPLPPEPEPEPPPPAPTPEAATTGPVLELTSEDAPPKGKRKPPAVPSWSYLACQYWEERFGAVTNGGMITRHLKPLIDRFGETPTLEAWQKYLLEKDPEFAQPADFARKPSLWGLGEAKAHTNGARPKNAPPTYRYEGGAELPKQKGVDSGTAEPE